MPETRATAGSGGSTPTAPSAARPPRPTRPADSGPRGASLRDVAERAGVSVKTVSNVVRGYPHVADGTRERVTRALAELQYRPNLSARSLRGGRSGLVALALPELDLPYFAELARWVIKAAEPRGWTVLLDQTDGVLERERLVLEGIRPHLIDGLLISPLAADAAAIAGRRDRTPLVLLGERVYDGPFDHVAIDNVRAAREATEHLATIGRRRIAAIGYQDGGPANTARLRHEGYVEALRGCGLPYDSRLVAATGAYHRAEGAAAMTDLLSRGEPPDAVFCFNDLLALGALRALHQHGLRVPEDVAVVGFDDIEDSRFSIPTLTTVRPDKEQIARLAVDLLAHRIDAAHGTAVDGDGPREVTTEHALVVRESTSYGVRPGVGASDGLG